MRILIAFLLGPALLSLWPASGEAAQLPTLPQAFIDSTYSPPSGNTIVVNAGGNLQTAINNALPGDTIVLQAGATFTGPFMLPNKVGSAWIHIRSSAYASLPPPGTRVSIADAANKPKIIVSLELRSGLRQDSSLAPWFPSVAARHHWLICRMTLPSTGAMSTA